MPPRASGVVFLDRDGVICENRPDYVKSWAELTFIPGAVEAIAALTRSRERLFVITNQSAIGRGLLTHRVLDGIHDRMLDVIAGAGGRVEAILVCPHHPDDHCACRKPEPGLLVEAALQHNIDLADSFFVGDAPGDLEAGARAGCRTVLVKTGLGEATARARSWKGSEPPAFIADDLVDAAIWILARRAEGVGAANARRER